MAWPDCAWAYSPGMPSRCNGAPGQFALQREWRGPGLSCPMRWRMRNTFAIMWPRCCAGRGRLQQELQRMGNSTAGPARPTLCCSQFGSLKAPAFIESMRQRGILVRDRSRDPRLRRLRAHHTSEPAQQTEQLLHAALREALDRNRMPGRRTRNEKSNDPTHHQRNRYPRSSLAIDGKGRYKISTGIRFFDHMLELFAHHGGFDLQLKAQGDLDVDQHHTVEDVGIVLGQAFRQGAGRQARHLARRIFPDANGRDPGLAAVDFCGRTVCRG